MTTVVRGVRSLGVASEFALGTFELRSNPGKQIGQSRFGTCTDLKNMSETRTVDVFEIRLHNLWRAHLGVKPAHQGKDPLLGEPLFQVFEILKRMQKPSAPRKETMVELKP